MAGAAVRGVTLVVRDVAAAARFYCEALGAPLLVCGERYAELGSGGSGSVAAPSDGVGVRVALLRGECEAQCSAGYSPLLEFRVVDLDAALTRALAMGAAMDGPLQHLPHGKLAALRAPDGHMVGLYEPSNPHTDGAG
eukprot:jgi/Chlat1/1201/Chrsp115S00741